MPCVPSGCPVAPQLRGLLSRCGRFCPRLTPGCSRPPRQDSRGAMDSMFEDDISILTQEALGPDEDWLDSPNTDLSGEMCSASHFALITAYDDIKNRLTGLERENSTLKRRLKMYEVKVRAPGPRAGGEAGGRGGGRGPGVPLTALPRGLSTR